MAGIMGLISEEELKTHHSFTNRRQTFWNYPEGAATLMYLLSLMEDEKTDTPKNFGWEELRYAYIKTTTVTTGTVFHTEGTTTPAADPLAISADDVIAVRVVSATDFQVNDSVALMDVDLQTGSNKTNLRGVIKAIHNTNYLLRS